MISIVINFSNAKSNLIEIKLNENVIVVNFSRVECYFVEKNLGFILEAFMTFIKT